MRTRRTQSGRTAPQQVQGMSYPVALPANFQGIKPTSVPQNVYLKITNTNTEEKLVPIGNMNGLNDRANQMILEAYRNARTNPNATLNEALVNYNREEPIAGVKLETNNGKPLLSVYETLKISPMTVSGIIFQSENTGHYNEQIQIEYSDTDATNAVYNRDLSAFKDTYAQDSSELTTNISFFFNYQATLFVLVKGGAELKIKFLAGAHLNRFVFK